MGLPPVVQNAMALCRSGNADTVKLFSMKTGSEDRGIPRLFSRASHQILTLPNPLHAVTAHAFPSRSIRISFPPLFSVKVMCYILCCIMYPAMQISSPHNPSSSSFSLHEFVCDQAWKGSRKGKEPHRREGRLKEDQQNRI